MVHSHIKLLVPLTLLLLFNTAHSQCCSPGNPIGGSFNQGVSGKKTLSLFATYNYSYSGKYMEGSKDSEFDLIDNGNYNFLVFNVAYGISHRFTTEFSAGYFINKSQTYNLDPPQTLTGSGFSNAYLIIKSAIISKPAKEFELTVGLGGKFPFSKQPQVVDNVELPQDVQPSTGAFGIVGQVFIYKGYLDKHLRVFFSGLVERNFENINNYQYGNAYIAALFVSKSVGEHFIVIGQLRNEFRQQDKRDNKTIESSGSDVLYFSPQINYNFKTYWNISMITDIPLYRYYNGTQLAHGYGVRLILSRKIQF